MITLDTLRAAALSNQPWLELDKLVRAELAAGRLTRAIYDEIMSLQEAVSDTPGYTEDSHDAIGDTLDALVGFCRAECAYKNPPVLPTVEEIAKLPRLARVAFAARCALRVLPLFRHKWPDAPADFATMLDRAVSLGEEAAAAVVRGENWAPFAGAITSAAYVCDAVLNADRDRVRAVEVINGTSTAIANFKDMAENVLDPYVGQALHTITTYTSIIIANAITPRPTAYHVAEAVGNTVIRRDFDHLARLAEWQHWADDTPVPPEVFGPLWPEGPPKQWPTITDVPARADLPIELFARERATEQMIEEDVVHLFNALNRYHIARSGMRLTLEQFRSLISDLVPAEA